MEPEINAAVIPVTPFQQNCSIVWCLKTKQAAVVDPGGDLDRILGAIDEVGVTVEKILVTHGHIDHAGGVAELAERLDVPIEGPQVEDRFWLDDLPQQGAIFGFSVARAFEPGRWLDQGDTVSVGAAQFDVYHCPGHTPGHVAFHHVQAKLAIVGDVLFRGSIGRSDLPRGDHDTLVRSIRERLWPLGDDVTFIPGHGPLSTFGDERRTNPFVGDNALA